MRRAGALLTALAGTLGLSPGALAQERGPVQACQFLAADPGVVPAWTDSLLLVKRERGTVPDTDPEVVILTLMVRNAGSRQVYFDGVGPATPALWTPASDESSWRLLSLSCLSGRRAHALAPGAELRFSYSTVAEEEDLVVGLVLSVEGEEGWAVAVPSAQHASLRAAAARPSSSDRMQARRED
jgi:hypothetical protein